MPVGGTSPLELKAISGIRIGTASAGISQTHRDDLTLFELGEQTRVAAVFTNNKFCAAPVTLAKKHLSLTTPRYLLINSGNANAGLGDAGIQTAQLCCNELAKEVGLEETQVLPFSTGAIGEPLPVEKLMGGLQAAVDKLSE